MAISQLSSLTFQPTFFQILNVMFDSDAAKETPAKIAEFYLSKPMKFI